MTTENEKPQMDWEGLKTELAKFPIKNTTLIAEMPRFPPPRILSSIPEGIHPDRNMFNYSKKSKYYGNSDEDKSKE